MTSPQFAIEIILSILLLVFHFALGDNAEHVCTMIETKTPYKFVFVNGHCMFEIFQNETRYKMWKKHPTDDDEIIDMEGAKKLCQPYGAEMLRFNPKKQFLEPGYQALEKLVALIKPVSFPLDCASSSEDVSVPNCSHRATPKQSRVFSIRFVARKNTSRVGPDRWKVLADSDQNVYPDIHRISLICHVSPGANGDDVTPAWNDESTSANDASTAITQHSANLSLMGGMIAVAYIESTRRANL